MANRWLRWRGYMDELEEVARICGGQVAEAEARIADDYERETWPKTQSDAWPEELVRRALDIPFLRELVEAAWSVGPGELTPPDGPSRSWRDGEREASEPSARRARQAPAPPAPASGAAPARLRSAERALAHRTRSIAVLLERPVNPRNVSAVIRTAEVFGHQEVHVIQPEGRARLMRTATTSCERYLDLFWYRDEALAVKRLHDRGYRILAADYGPGSRPLDEIPLGDKVAVALGSEQRGVSPELRDAADGLFHIPTAGFISYLNLSVAAALSLYEVDRRMRREGRRAPLAKSDRAELRRAWYSVLAGSDDARLREYLAWVDSPPEPGPLIKDVPSREKKAEGSTD